jgi:hypothetical protein
MKNAVFWDVTPCGSCKKKSDVSEESITSIFRAIYQPTLHCVISQKIFGEFCNR